jgi:hypothetical protein
LNRIVPLEEGPSGPRRTIKEEWQSQAHRKWAGKYHGTIVPKYREKAIHGRLTGSRLELGIILSLSQDGNLTGGAGPAPLRSFNRGRGAGMVERKRWNAGIVK